MWVIKILLKALSVIGIKTNNSYSFAGNDGRVYSFEKVNTDRFKEFNVAGVNFIKVIKICEEERLTRILLRVKKPRVKKKLEKRIAKLKRY